MAIPNPNPNIADGIKSDNKTYSSNKIESLIKTATELPIPEAGDAGKVLTVNSDADGYELDVIPAELPTPEAGDAGKVLTVNEDLEYDLESIPAELPVTETGDEGKILTVDNNGDYVLETPPTIPDEIGAYQTADLVLSDLTWTASGSGAYYTTIDLDALLPADKSIIAVSLSGWSNLRTTDNLVFYIRTSRSIGILSNVNSFADATSSLKATVLYK